MEDDMDDWKELEKGNTPPDITKENYEWQWNNKPENDDPWCICGWDPGVIFLNLWKGFTTRKFRYRELKPEPKQPTHEEIWAKTWKQDNGVWFRVLEYHMGKYLTNYKYEDWEDKSYFTDRESADIPPEDI